MQLGGGENNGKEESDCRRKSTYAKSGNIPNPYRCDICIALWVVENIQSGCADSADFCIHHRRIYRRGNPEEQVGYHREGYYRFDSERHAGDSDCVFYRNDHRVLDCRWNRTVINLLRTEDSVAEVLLGHLLAGMFHCGGGNGKRLDYRRNPGGCHGGHRLRNGNSAGGNGRSGGIRCVLRR